MAGPTIWLRTVLIALAVVALVAPSARAAEKKPPVMDGPYYMRPATIVAPKFVGGGIVHVGVSVAIEIKDREDYEKVREQEPRLIDAFVRELNAIVSGPWI